MSQLSLPEFADRMNRVLPLVIKEFARRQVDELYKGNITLPQFLVLEFLYRKGESKMTTLAYFMGVSTAAMTGIIDRLVRDSYCIRAREPDDRRIIKIKLTAKASKLVRKISRQRRKMIINIFGKITGQERENYLKTLMRISEILARNPHIG